MKIKLKDKVKILSGKDRGKTGIVERIYSKQDKILVKGINLYKKHIKKSEQFPKGTIVEVNRPLFISKTILVCPNCNKVTRVGYSLQKTGKKERICKKCNKVIN